MEQGRSQAEGTYAAESPKCMPIFTFGLWSMIRDCLGPTPSHKASSVFELACGAHPLQSPRQYPIKEKHVGSEATEQSTPPYENRFPITLQFNPTMIQILI
jgi:hypothetical protein